MKLRFNKAYIKHYAKLPPPIRSRADKQLRLLLENPSHPSLRFKKMEGKKNQWELSVTMNYRITVAIKGNTYVLRDIGSHDILDKQ